MFLLLAMAAPLGQQASLDLSIGQPISRSSGNVQVAFDGESHVEIRSPGNSMRLNALAPAKITISPDAKHALHNFGDASGQVLDLRVYELGAARLVNIQHFKDAVLSFARLAPGCRPRADEISYVATGWVSNSILAVQTEDWTRRPGCSRLHRKWRLVIP